jgi:hypothetical protein
MKSISDTEAKIKKSKALLGSPYCGAGVFACGMQGRPKTCTTSVDRIILV